MIATIGHSTHPISEFIKILQAHGISVLIDVRTIPKSRHNPQFNEETLQKSLKKAGIKYIHQKKLGGLRHTTKDSLNTGWRNKSFRGYADYMQTREFIHAIRWLMKSAKGKKVAIMCAEGNPFRCHRSLIADALTVRGRKVWHISGVSSKSSHRLTPFATIKGTKITYP